LNCPLALVKNAGARPFQLFVEICDEAYKDVPISPGLHGLWQTDDADSDRVITRAIRSHLKKGIRAVDVDSNVNDPIFADRAAQVFLELSGQSGVTASYAARSRALS
jgi:hypothetical protein